jgi:hypothetical protein
MRDFRRTIFKIESLTGKFPGFSDGSLWNGWACPYFEKNIAEEILLHSQQNGYNWYYDSQLDAFVVSHKDDPSDFEPEIFQSVLKHANGYSTRLYGIGTYSWIWQEETVSVA